MRQSGAIWAVTTIVIASIAGIVALAAVGDKDASTLLPLLIGFLAPTIAAMVAANKSEQTAAGLTKIDHRLNGDLDKRIEAAVKAALETYHCAKKEDVA